MIDGKADRTSGSVHSDLPGPRVILEILMGLMAQHSTMPLSELLISLLAHSFSSLGGLLNIDIEVPQNSPKTKKTITKSPGTS